MTYDKFIEEMEKIGFTVEGLIEQSVPDYSRFKMIQIYGPEGHKFADVSKDMSFIFNIEAEHLMREFSREDKRKDAERFLNLIVKLSCTPVPER